MTSKKIPHEYKVVSLRECPTPLEMQFCDEPKSVVAYWRLHVATAPWFNPEVECLVTLSLNSKNRIKGHHVVSVGLLNQTLVHAREVFRAAVVAAASTAVLAHNHPSGDPTPSQEDLKSTRDMVAAGRILGIPLLDHVIVGKDRHVSLKEYGCMF